MNKLLIIIQSLSVMAIANTIGYNEIKIPNRYNFQKHNEIKLPNRYNFQKHNEIKLPNRYKNYFKSKNNINKKDI